MTDKIIYFTAGQKATSGELEDIAKLELATEPRYQLQVRNVWGSLEPTDFVAGTIPTAYLGSDIIDPDNLPSGLPATQAIVSNGEVITVGAATYTLTVVDGVVTNVVVGTTEV